METPMKFFLPFLLFVFFSCAHQDDPIQEVFSQEVTKESPHPTFLTREEVFQELRAYETKNAVTDAPLTPEEKERESHLIPNKDFLVDLPRAEKSFLPTDIKDAPPSVDLRGRDTPIKSQDDGKCTAFSGTAAVENTLQKDGVIPGLDLSEWHSWSLYKKYSAEAFIKALTTHRIGDEVDYPQYGKPKATLRPHTMISKQKYLDDDVPSVVAALAKGHVVYLAMETPKEMLRCPKVISPNTKPAGGGHALLISGYYLEGNRPVAILKNSWGKDCGDHGYQYLPLEICHKKGFYCSFWEIEAVDHLSGVIPQPAPTAEVKRVCSRPWYAPWKKNCVNVPL
jgi:hypothetical protein